ncbi:hypothetical protein JTB14_008506 [Gonioctena quinquepunctata]|nr:hypothetical protein JTB14_008506 [Gonioctena quinquepunctata]
MFAFGNIMVWSSPVLPKLRSNDTEINPLGEAISTSQISLMMGIPALVSLVTTFFLGKLPDVIGRKRTMQYMATGMLFSNVALAFGTHIYVYYAARTTFYIFVSSAMINVQVYLSEIAGDHNRGKLGCLMGVAVPSGNLYAFILGPIMSVKVFTLLCTVPLVLGVFCFLFVPESPVYLASKGRKMETLQALKKLGSYKTSEDIEKDYIKIENTSKAKMRSAKPGFVTLFQTRALRKGIVISLIVNSTQFCSGIVVIMSFLGPIFTDADTKLSGNTVAIIVGAVKIIVFLVTTFTIEKLGRRPLLLFSSLLTGIPLLFLGIFFYWKNTNSSFIEDISTLPIWCILAYVVFYSLGLGPIPMAIIGELFPNEFRSIATTFVMSIVAILIGILNAAYPVMAEYFGIHWCIWIFSGFCFLGFSLIYFHLPETKGKSLKEIQGILST